jgi:hypothetical protein
MHFLIRSKTLFTSKLLGYITTFKTKSFENFTIFFLYSVRFLSEKIQALLKIVENE